MTDEKKKVLSYIDEKADVIIDTSDKIWDFAELSLREFKSGELYAQVLKEEGFEVEHPFCGIETAVSYTHLDVYKRQGHEYLHQL